MDTLLATRLAQTVRASDPDRYFSSLFAPANHRPYLHALYAFNHEVAHVAESVREPMLGAIRLEWWRETAEGAAKGNPRNHDVARGLAALFGAYRLALADFEAIIAARTFDSSGEHFADFAGLESYLDATGGGVMRLAAQILGGDPAVTREAAQAYGLAGVLRSRSFHSRRHKLYLPLDLLSALHLTADEFFILDNDPRIGAAVRQTGLRARDHFLAARRGPKPRASLPALLPAALVPVYIKKLGRDVPIHRRQMALLAAAMKQRL
ncbi:MAG TPA: squalene/phytoene synthase family protein [Rhizomicrobium sp.]|jgi:phytoene synthase